MTIATTMPWPGRRRKYRNQPTEYDGRTYASKLEASHAAGLDVQKRAKLIRGWKPQVSFPVGPGERIMIDFVVVDLDGRWRLQDTKGVMTPLAKSKIKRLEADLGVSVEIVKRRRR